MKNEKTDSFKGISIAETQYLFDIDYLLDCHTHMLPGIDDGAKNVEISEELINHSIDKNINYICLTPHFYPDEMKIESFLEMRKEMYNEVEDKTHTRLGAEIAYYVGIGDSKDIAQLTLGSSKYILIEMPFERWRYFVVEDMIKLLYRGFIPIIAHYERFLKYENMRYIKYLKNNGCLIQSNSEFFLNKKTAKKAIKHFNNGLIDLVASDSHNLESRKQTLPEALVILIQSAKENAVYNMINKYEVLTESIFKIKIKN